MRTARQGTLDGLCGLYAVINALEPAGLEISRGSTLPAELFQQLVYGLGAVNLLTAMHEGLNADELVATATLAFSWLYATHGVQLELSLPFRTRRRPRTMKPFLRGLRELVAAPDTAVILSYERPTFGHWTVVHEVQARRLLLRDSSHGGVLHVSDFVLGDGPNRIVAANTVVVRRLA